jgi:hypothetical protein
MARACYAQVDQLHKVCTINAQPDPGASHQGTGRDETSNSCFFCMRVISMREAGVGRSQSIASLKRKLVVAQPLLNLLRTTSTSRRTTYGTSNLGLTCSATTQRIVGPSSSRISWFAVTRFDFHQRITKTAVQGRCYQVSTFPGSSVYQYSYEQY